MYRVLRDFAGITLGCLLTAVSLNMFLVPNKIADGGLSGWATIFYYVFGWPVGMSILAMNIPLLIAGYKVLGTRTSVRTIFGAVVLSLGVDLLKPYVPVLTHNMLLGSLYGGVLCGIGMGIVFKCKGTTAGTDLLAAILNKLFRISVGQALLATDFMVIVAAGIAFQSAEASLYALIALFVTTQIIDLVQEGRSEAKAFFIITEEPARVAERIMTEMERGVTFFSSRGAYTGEAKESLICVVHTTEVTAVKEMIYEEDINAFVIICDAHEVLGRGFRPIKI